MTLSTLPLFLERLECRGPEFFLVTELYAERHLRLRRRSPPQRPLPGKRQRSILLLLREMWLPSPSPSHDTQAPASNPLPETSLREERVVMFFLKRSPPPPVREGKKKTKRPLFPFLWEQFSLPSLVPCKPRKRGLLLPGSIAPFTPPEVE